MGNGVINLSVKQIVRCLLISFLFVTCLNHLVKLLQLLWQIAVLYLWPFKVNFVSSVITKILLMVTSTVLASTVE